MYVAREARNDGADCRGVAGFQRQDYRCRLPALLPDGCIVGVARSPQTYCLWGRRQPHRDRVLCRFDGALLWDVYAGEQETLVGCGVVQPYGMRHDGP